MKRKSIGSGIGRVPLRVLLALALVIPGAELTQAWATGDPTDLGVLAVGDAVFWEGPFVQDATVFWELCDAVGPCFDYAFELAESGARLRVAIDYPDYEDIWAFGLYSPSGQLLPLVYDPVSDVAQDGAQNQATADLNCCDYSLELSIDLPEAGIWKVRVAPVDVHSSSFRMRAKLEAVPINPDPPVVRSPDLRMLPPFAFTFAAPARQVRLPVGTPLRYQRLDVAGQQPMSCTVDETIENGARRCLRFSVGVENVGDGPLDLRFAPVADGSSAMSQRVHSSDGTWVDGPAGTYVFHKTHLHYHYTDMATIGLYRVVDPGTGQLVEAGEGLKQGYCLGPTKIAEFHTFDQDLVDSAPSDCSSPTAASMTLPRGWTDVYGWHLPGNYVEFGDNADGYYVIRAEADALGRLIETREDNNTSYSYVRVTGNVIEVLERGRGSDPWDPAKTVIKDW